MRRWNTYGILKGVDGGRLWIIHDRRDDVKF